MMFVRLFAVVLVVIGVAAALATGLALSPPSLRITSARRSRPALPSRSRAWDKASWNAVRPYALIQVRPKTPFG